MFEIGRSWVELERQAMGDRLDIRGVYRGVRKIALDGLCGSKDVGPRVLALARALGISPSRSELCWIEICLDALSHDHWSFVVYCKLVMRYK